MRNIVTIAKNTFGLEVRDRILIGILIFALGYMVLTLFLSDLVLKELPMVKSLLLQCDHGAVPRHYFVL